MLIGCDTSPTAWNCDHSRVWMIVEVTQDEQAKIHRADSTKADSPAVTASATQQSDDTKQPFGELSFQPVIFIRIDPW
ncbi:hypothetical protein Y032_0034g2944 [Ancylostoma ceylanicum]|uniref:Uncharacterized protein n=1 Tax=Ancylostoma ceylanicum TaxID=53326 RepID=A0A016UMB7_9BILA|nr:hypothetical protein Y032_0034g2944 [Ancylostoma ceylanicum]